MMVVQKVGVVVCAFVWLGNINAFGAVRGSEAMYVGGTLNALPEKTEGKLDTSHEKMAKFVWKKGEVLIPYDKVTSLEYGQKAGRRVGVAIAVTPFALFSKKRKHFLTLGYQDVDGKPQGVVLELAKDTVRTVLATVEARTGKPVEFESEEAKKHIGN